MKEYKLMREIRNKENKSQTEEILLNYQKVIEYISEVLVDETKWHMSSEEAIELIREYMSKNI